MSSGSVIVSPRGAERARGGHPWIYRSDVAEVHAGGGEIVRVLGPRKRVIGHALYSDRSEIAVRLLTRGAEPAGVDLVRRRLAAAVEFRKSLAIESTAYRLVHAEGDLLPSLIVDRYGDFLVVQALSQGADRLLPEIVKALVELVSPAGVLARNDARVRGREGLPLEVRVLHGEVLERAVVREGGIELEVDLWKGQKTGLFLDQRENREAATRYARGRCLDCFSYLGGFALTLAGICTEVLAVDISEEAVTGIMANAARNRLPNVTARAANAFDLLRELERAGERFDTIVLDPPAFAKSRATLDRALPGYKEINLRALKILNPGGTLVTCSCSYHVSEATFAEVVRSAAADAHAEVSLIERRMQSRDHPVLLGVPETHYLKCFLVRKLES